MLDKLIVHARSTDLTDPLSKIPELIEQGEKFTYLNYAQRTNEKHAAYAFTEDWLVWVHHVEKVKEALGSSPTARSIERGFDADLLRGNSEKFKASLSLVMTGLRAAQRIYAEEIPASDRTVTLNDNDRANVVERVEELITAVAEANDFPGTPLDKEQVVAELSAGRRLLEATRVRLTALITSLRPALRFIMDKGGGTIVSKIATGLYDLLISLKLPF